MNTNNLNMIGNFGANSVQNYSLGQSDQSAKQEAVEEKLIDFSFTSSQKEMVSEELNASTDYLGEIDEDGDGKVTDNELLGFLKSLFNKQFNEGISLQYLLIISCFEVCHPAHTISFFDNSSSF